MQPRLPTSIKWTPVPAEFVEKVVNAFADRFSAEAAHGEFLAEGRIYPEELLLRVGYLETGRLRQMNFETSMAFDPKKTNAMERLYLGLDAAAGLMEEYFDAMADAEDDEDALQALDFPTEWRPYEFEGETLYLQTSTVNSKLEDEADRLLGLKDGALVSESQESEDALSRAIVDTDLAKEVQRQIRKGPSIN